ncbi:MAG: Ada metal-binding domain-containing protein [Candidatus Paceibacterota bacterium]
MTIAESSIGDKSAGSWGSQIKALLGDWVFVGIFILSSGLCFGLGLLSAKANAPKGPDNSLWIEQLPASELSATTTSSKSGGTVAVPPSKPVEASKAIPAQPAAAAAAVGATTTSVPPSAHNYVASKSGTKYYLPSCGAVSRIKEENRVYFATKAAAEVAGYQPSTACKGL